MEPNLTAILFAAGHTPDAQRDALEEAIRDLPYDEQLRVVAQALLGFADLALGIIDTASSLGGDTRALVRAIVDDHLAEIITESLDDDLDELLDGE